MRTRINTIMLAAMAFMAAGCGDDSMPDVDGNPQPDVAKVPSTAAGTAVTVRVGVGEMEKRAGHSTDNLPDEFILYFDAEAVGGNKYDNVTMTRDDATGQYQPSVPMEWGTESREAFVRAWTEPAAVSDGIYHPVVRVAYDQTTADSIKISDFLCASTYLGDEDAKSVTVVGDELHINFVHVFSRIDIRCHLGNELTSRYPDAKVSKVEIGGVYRGGPFNFDYGSLVLAGNDYVTDQGAVTAYLNAADAITGDVTAEAIMVPQYFTYDLQSSAVADERATLTVTLANNGVDKVMPPVKITTGSFEAGKRYTMTVNIGDDYVTVGEITALPWADGGHWTLKTE